MKFINRCNSIFINSVKGSVKASSLFDDILPHFQTLTSMQHIGQEAALRLGDFQIEVINRAIFVIKRY